jgi:hypothetical protein
MTIGDVERSRGEYVKFADQIIGKKYPSVTIVSKILENTGHSGTKSETYGRGLQYIFQKPDLNLAHEILDRHAGTYQLQNGNKVEVKKENGSLTLYVSPNNYFNLHAASESHFYSNQELFHINFSMNAGKTEGLTLTRFGSLQSAKKIIK